MGVGSIMPNPQKIYLDDNGELVGSNSNSGIIEKGNIDLYKQPVVNNPKGGKSTVYSKSYNLDGAETLLPSVTPDGRFLATDDDILNEYKKTGRHLGKFNSVDTANKYAEQLHNDYESGKYSSEKNKTYLHPDTGDELDHTDNIKEVTGEPSDFAGGFLKSIFDGEAFTAGLKGGWGFLKGATLDIPETLINTAKSIYEHPFKSAAHTLLPGPLGDMVTGDDSMAGLRDASKYAGSNPDAFGRIMGQLTGQPLVMDGSLNLAPRVSKIVAPAVEGTGRIMKNYTPISNTAGVAVGGAYGGIPGAIAGTYRPFTKPLRAIERFAGQGIENVGKRMRGSSVTSEPDLVSNITNEDVKDLPKEGNISGYKVIRNERPLSDIATEFLSKKKKVRMNSDGTFTDMNTGEMFDKKGNSIIEINGDSPEKFQSPDRNSSFFFKNRS
jgi:hypothetical protein